MRRVMVGCALASLLMSGSCSPANRLGVGVQRSASGGIVATTFPCRDERGQVVTFLEVGPPSEELWTASSLEPVGSSSVEIGRPEPGWRTANLAPWITIPSAHYEVRVTMGSGFVWVAFQQGDLRRDRLLTFQGDYLTLEEFRQARAAECSGLRRGLITAAAGLVAPLVLALVFLVVSIVRRRRRSAPARPDGRVLSGR